MTASLSYSWVHMGDLWPHLDPKEGLIMRIGVEGEESLLLIACALPNEDGAGWRISLLLGEKHIGKQGFASREVAQQAAEEALTQYLRRNHLMKYASVATTFEDPFHEVAAQLVSQLDDDMQIVHITEYRKEWVALCLSLDRTRAEDYAFVKDSDGLMGTRTQWERFEGYDLANFCHQCARATWIATVRFPSPRGEVGVDVFKDTASRWHFGIDSSFLAQEFAEVIPNPFLHQAFLDMSNEGSETELEHCSAFLVLGQLDEHSPTSQPEANPVRCLGRIAIERAHAGEDIVLELFEAGRLFAVESGFLQRGNRTVIDPFDETGDTTYTLPEARLAATTPVVIDISCRREKRREA